MTSDRLRDKRLDGIFKPGTFMEYEYDPVEMVWSMIPDSRCVDALPYLRSDEEATE